MTAYTTAQDNVSSASPDGMSEASSGRSLTPIEEQIYLNKYPDLIHEKLERDNHDLKRHLDIYISKVDRSITQYEKILGQLKSEIEDKERQCHTIETKVAHARQKLSQKPEEPQMKTDDMKHALLNKENDLKQ